jgi:arginyl-tRNA--protein-N-Asp/Glu arginylyltransferase
VYFYFDPAESWRSLGVFGALCEIEECRRRGLPYWYIGLYIRDCPKMNYKIDYRPCELLGSDGTWSAALPKSIADAGLIALPPRGTAKSLSSGSAGTPS